MMLSFGFQRQADATLFLTELRERVGKFSLALHPEKTRLIEFGRYAAERRGRRGEGKPETFSFLGFTHICGISRKGRFVLTRKTRRDRMQAALRHIKVKLRERLHDSIADQGRWLNRVRIFRIPCGSDEPADSQRIPIPRDVVLAENAPSSKPEEHHDLGSIQSGGRQVAASRARRSPVARREVRRQLPTVGAECGNSARSDLCGGGGTQ